MITKDQTFKTMSPPVPMGRVTKQCFIIIIQYASFEVKFIQFWVRKQNGF